MAVGLTFINAKPPNQSPMLQATSTCRAKTTTQPKAVPQCKTPHCWHKLSWRHFSCPGFLCLFPGLALPNTLSNTKTGSLNGSSDVLLICWSTLHRDDNHHPWKIRAFKIFQEPIVWVFLTKGAVLQQAQSPADVLAPSWQVSRRKPFLTSGIYRTEIPKILNDWTTSPLTQTAGCSSQGQ